MVTNNVSLADLNPIPKTSYAPGTKQRETLLSNQYQDSNESEEDGDIVLMPNGRSKKRE